MVRVIVGLRLDSLSDDGAGAAGGDAQQTLELAGDADQSLELHGSGVRSDDGISWYWTDASDEAEADRLAERIRALPRVVSAFRQSPEGPP